MPLLDLPLEILQFIICEAIKCRGIKRGLRLRLLNKVFAREVIQALYIFRLLDSHFRSAGREGSSFVLPPFTANYLEYRAMNEHRSGLPNLVFIRETAECLSEEYTIEEHRRETTLLVKKLCCSIVERSLGPDSIHQESQRAGTKSLAMIFRDDDHSSKQTKDIHLFIASVITETIPIVRKWVTGGNDPYIGSCIFGHAFPRAARSGNLETVDLLLSFTNHDLFKTRIPLFQGSIYGGHLHIARFIFNFRSDEYTWRFSSEPRNNRHEYRRNLLWYGLKYAPCEEVWDYIMELRTFYPAAQSKLEARDMSLCWCAEKGWTDKLVYLLEHGASPNGPTPERIPWSDIRPRPIISACSSGQQNILQILLALNVNTSGAVETASKYGYLNIVRTLLERNVDTTGGLNNAVASGYRDVIELLLDHGSDPKEITPDSFAALVGLEHTPAFESLMERGAVLGEDAKKTCVARARLYGLDSMLALLEEYGADVAEG